MELLKKVIDLFFPHRCPICDEIISDSMIHNSCLRELIRIEDKSCIICGKYLEYEHICKDCKKYSHYFDRGFSIFIYDDNMKKSISKFKYSNRQEYAEFYSLEMARFLCRTNIKIDVIIPVPIHKKRLVKRGYNQSKLIADGIGKYLGVRVSDKTLYRKVNTPPLKELSRDKRVEVMKDAIIINEINFQRGSNVLLVDDIYTTGTTLDACAKILKEKGANKIYFITVAS